MSKTIKLKFATVSDAVHISQQGIKDTESKIIYWGQKNEYPEYLKFLYKNSGKHKSIIDYKILYTAGENPDPFIENILRDYYVFGGFAFLVRYKDNELKWFEHLEFEKVRLLTTGDYAISNDFIKIGRDNPFNFINNNRSSVLVYPDIKNIDRAEGGIGVVYYSNTESYPNPDYSGAINYIELDYRVSNFWLNSIKNNFSAGYVVNYLTPPPDTEEEKRKVYDALEQLFTSDENAGSFIVEWSPAGTKSLEINRLEFNDWDTKFQTLNNAIQQEIFVAHKVTSPMLFGIRTEGQLGGRNELLTAYNIFYRSFIIPNRNKVLRILEKTLGKKFEIIDMSPVTDDLLQYKDILTRNELREILGYPPINEEVQDAGLPSEAVIESKKKEAIKKLKEVNNNFKGYELVASRFVEDTVTDLTEIKFAEDYGKIILTPIIKNILDIIKTAGNIAPDMLAKAVGITAGELEQFLKYLAGSGYIIRGDNIVVITEQGKDALSETPITQVVYSYEWVEGFSDADIDKSRDFCKKMRTESLKRMAEGNLWTMEDIQKISSQVGYDVWLMRGGWYRIPNTTISVPHCRHTWKQHLITKKQ